MSCEYNLRKQKRINYSTDSSSGEDEEEIIDEQVCKKQKFQQELLGENHYDAQGSEIQPENADTPEATEELFLRLVDTVVESSPPLQNVNSCVPSPISYCETIIDIDPCEKYFEVKILYGVLSIGIFNNGQSLMVDSTGFVEEKDLEIGKLKQFVTRSDTETIRKQRVGNNLLGDGTCYPLPTKYPMKSGF